METVTVRRWVALDGDEIWRRLSDIEQLVADDPALELVDPPEAAGQLHVGDALVVRHQRGRRLTRLGIEVLTAQAPRRLVARVRTRATTWLLEVDVEPLEAGRSDLHLHARLDATRLGDGGLGVHPVPRRVADGIEALLDGIAHHVERATAA